MDYILLHQLIDKYKNINIDFYWLQIGEHIHSFSNEPDSVEILLNQFGDYKVDLSSVEYFNKTDCDILKFRAV